MYLLSNVSWSTKRASQEKSFGQQFDWPSCRATAADTERNVARINTYREVLEKSLVSHVERQ